MHRHTESGLCLLVQEYDRLNRRAYMLLYERVGGKLALPEAAAAAPSAPLLPAKTPASSCPAGAPQLTAEATDTEMVALLEAGPQRLVLDSIQAVIIGGGAAIAHAIRAAFVGSPQPTSADEGAGAPAHERVHRSTFGYFKISLVIRGFVRCCYEHSSSSL